MLEQTRRYGAAVLNFLNRASAMNTTAHGKAASAQPYRSDERQPVTEAREELYGTNIHYRLC